MFNALDVGTDETINYIHTRHILVGFIYTYMYMNYRGRFYIHSTTYLY